MAGQIFCCPAILTSSSRWTSPRSESSFVPSTITASRSPGVVLDVAGEPDEGAGVKGCVFCAIARGEAPADVVLAAEAGVAFLDRRPLLPGHVLLVPRGHVPTLPDLPVERVGPFFHLAQRLARAVPEAMGAEGSFVAINNVVSQSVPHLHVHVVPRNHDD